MVKNNKILVIWVAVLAFIGCISILIYFLNKLEGIQTSHKRHLAFLNQKHREELQIKERECRAELEVAWGGGVLVAVKDPDLNIAGMLHKAAVLACPHCSKVEVKTDNFTEFDIFLHVNKVINKKEAAETMKILLKYCAKYVNSASFVYQDEVVKTIDKRGIDTIKNWSSVPLATISRKMYNP